MNWTKSLLNDERSAQQAHAGRASDKRQRAMARRRRAALPPPRLRAATPAALDGSESAATAKPLPTAFGRASTPERDALARIARERSMTWPRWPWNRVCAAAFTSTRDQPVEREQHNPIRLGLSSRKRAHIHLHHSAGTDHRNCSDCGLK